MPSRTPSSEDALPRKGALTLTRLVDYDDRITDALVDRVSTRRTSQVLRPGHSLSTGLLLVYYP